MKKFLTTGDIANICGVAPRTASKWIDSGKLTGFRIPGSLDRRVDPNDLIDFMKRHKFSEDRIPSMNSVLACVSEEVMAVLPADITERVSSLWEAAVATTKRKWSAIAVDADFLPGDAAEIARRMAASGVPVLYVTAEDGYAPEFPAGNIKVITRPIDRAAVERFLAKTVLSHRCSADGRMPWSPPEAAKCLSSEPRSPTPAK